MSIVCLVNRNHIMKKTFVFLIAINAILSSYPGFSQQSKIDSLVQVLKTAKEDTVKANNLNLLSREYARAGEHDLARKCSAEAFSLSEKLNFIPGIVSAHLNKGIPYFYEGNYEEALKNYNAALSVSEKGNYKRGIALSYNNMGLVYTYQRKYSEGLKAHHKAKKMFEEAKDTAGLANSNNNLGIIYEEQGNYTEALQSYFTALRFAEARGDKKAMGDGYLNIANVFYLQKSYKDAIAKFLSALKLYEEIGFKMGMAHCYGNLGGSYQEVGNLDSALRFCEKGYEIVNEIGDKVSAGQAKNIIGHIHNKQGRYAEGLADFSTALKVFSEMKDTLNMSTSYLGIGEVYSCTGRFNEALKFYNTGLELAKAVGFKSNVAFIYGFIADAYEKKGDYKNAYLNHKLHFALTDSILNEAKSKQVAEMQTRYETERKDNEITLLSKDKEIQDIEIKKQKQLKYSFMGGLGLIIVLMLFGYRTYRTRQVLRLQDIRNKIAGDLHDDIGSTLNSISVYSEVARKKDEQQDEALEMIGDASRKIIDAMSDIVWTVNPDNDSFAKIIFRMKSLAYNLFRAKKIEYTFHADESLEEKKLPLEDRRNFYLIFKEAVNNLVKYSNASRVAITLLSENSTIKLRIQDNGVGFDTSQDAVGNGLKNMKRRANEMKADLKIESSKGNGTQIELTLKA
jgi:two-component system, NarL family, sensor histidine kinase UhpB